MLPPVHVQMQCVGVCACSACAVLLIDACRLAPAVRPTAAAGEEVRRAAASAASAASAAGLPSLSDMGVDLSSVPGFDRLNEVRWGGGVR